MTKFIRIFSLLLAVSVMTYLQSCDKEDPTPIPVATAPTTVASVQVGTKADVTFTFTAEGGFSTASVAATGGTAAIKTNGTAGATTGSVVAEFTADNTAGAGTVTLTLTDSEGQTATATATLNKTISAPPTVSIGSTTSVNVNPGATHKVTVTVTAANGVKSVAYTTTGGLTGSPASPITISSGTTTDITFTVPANTAIGTVMTAVISATDNQNLNSTPVTLTVTASTNELTGQLTANTTLKKGTPYLIKGQYIVMSGVTLTVEAGAVIRGDKTSKGVLVVKQGGKIEAVGTATEPIVFTSSQPVGERDRGDWGGIIIMGDAYVNQSGKPTVEGLTATDATFFQYGTPSTSNAATGTNDQNSGTLKYVRIEYAGIELIPNSETNALTMAAVGSGTTIDYVQASYGGDDGFEWFGGTVSAKHLVSLATWDDDFDTDFGWRGNVQWGVAVRAPFVADQSGSTAFESDSQGNANAIGTVCDSPAGGTGAAPTSSTAGSTAGCTQGVFSNMTVFGPRELAGRAISANYTRAMHIRRRTAISLFNSVITGWPQGLQMDDQGTLDNYKGGIGVFQNNVLFVPIAPTSTTNAAFASGNSYYGSNVTTSVVDGATANPTGTLPDYWTGGSANVLVGGTVVTATNGNRIPNWAATAVAADNTINPYTDYSIAITSATSSPFYLSSTSANYASNPNFAITTGSLTGQTAATLFANAKLGTFFDKTLTYKGAFGATDWTDGWSEFQPLNKVY